jgi:hypothetical protein
LLPEIGNRFRFYYKRQMEGEQAIIYLNVKKDKEWCPKQDYKYPSVRSLMQHNTD